jgi:hypothetical protein
MLIRIDQRGEILALRGFDLFLQDSLSCMSFAFYHHVVHF